MSTNPGSSQIHTHSLKPKLSTAHHTKLTHPIITKYPTLTTTEQIAIFSKKRVTLYKCRDSVGADHLSLPKLPKPIRVLLFGSSHVVRFPDHIYNDINNIITKKLHVSRIGAENTMRRASEIHNFRENIDAVVLIIGGNDVDQPDLKGTDMRKTIKHFIHLTQTFIYDNIPTFIFPIMERKRPSHLKPQLYKDLIYHYNKELQNFSNEYNYPILINFTFTLELQQDGIHFSTSDYVKISQKIKQHINTHIHSAVFLMKVAEFTQSLTRHTLLELAQFYAPNAQSPTETTSSLITETPSPTPTPAVTIQHTTQAQNITPIYTPTTSSQIQASHTITPTAPSISSLAISSITQQADSNNNVNVSNPKINSDAWRQRLLDLSAQHKRKVNKPQIIRKINWDNVKEPQ